MDQSTTDVIETTSRPHIEGAKEVVQLGSTSELISTNEKKKDNAHE